MSIGGPGGGFGNSGGFGGNNRRYGSGGTYGFNTGTSTPSGGNTWQSTATTLLPWLAFLYGVYNDRNRGDGGFQQVPQTPEQKRLYEMAMQQFQGMAANNQAAFNLALPGAMSAPGKFDVGAMREGRTGYSGPTAPNPADLQRILTNTSTPSPTGGTQTPPPAATPQVAPGQPPTKPAPVQQQPTPQQPPPDQPPNQQAPPPLPMLGRDPDFGKWLAANGGQDVIGILDRYMTGAAITPEQRATVYEWWQRYAARKG